MDVIALVGLICNARTVATRLRYRLPKIVLEHIFNTQLGYLEALSPFFVKGLNDK